MDENNAISVVENLIEICKDGQKGYQDAAEHAKAADLKQYFREQGAERGKFAHELHAELAKLGKPEKKVSGSAGGAMHRAWIDTKVAMVEETRRFSNQLNRARILRRTPTTKL